MTTNVFQILVLAVIQGMAELLPVSSSAHVIVTEKLMGLDPSSPEMTFLLVMLHTGTMFAVLAYFWKRWRALLSSSKRQTAQFLRAIAAATLVTAVIGYGLKIFIEKVFFHGIAHAEVEHLFGNLRLVSISLFSAGALITFAGTVRKKGSNQALNDRNAAYIGAVQGLCLPFRGFSRSGATISVGMLRGVSRELAEEFSFALAVVLTPPVIVREFMRLLKATHATGQALSHTIFLPGFLGMVFSFGAGLIALRWVSSWIEKGRWKYFGYYCFAAAALVFALSFSL